jgi:hypothetical protein
MYKLRMSQVRFLITVSVLGLITAPQVHAGRICVHGHSGTLENPGQLLGLNYVTPRGNYLEVPKPTEPGGYSHGVHYSIPVNADEEEYSTIRIRYAREFGANLDRVEVYSGEGLVQEFERDTDYQAISPSHYGRPAARYLYLHLDRPARFWNGIGVSLRPASCPSPSCPSMGDKLYIMAVCAFE